MYHVLGWWQYHDLGRWLVFLLNDYVSSPPVMKDPACENSRTSEMEEDEEEPSTTEEGGLEQNQPSELCMESPNSPGEGRGPLKGNPERPDAGEGWNEACLHHFRYLGASSSCWFDTNRLPKF